MWGIDIPLTPLENATGHPSPTRERHHESILSARTPKKASSPC
ncbi:hypothetical protein RGAI101_1689 [Roseobacter sp. GAI101]|nr:hypothetical protein RGAI101_1689 [Roseobacter sp. GAI101]